MEIRYQYLFVNPPEQLGDAEKHAIDTSAEVRCHCVLCLPVCLRVR